MGRAVSNDANRKMLNLNNTIPILETFFLHKSSALGWSETVVQNKARSAGFSGFVQCALASDRIYFQTILREAQMLSGHFYLLGILLGKL